MVAAWIKALTVVGPSIASGSQVCSGNWADFPTAPPNRRSGMRVSSCPFNRPTRGAISLNRSVPNSFQMMRTATRKRTSPTRVTKNAFFAAAAAFGEDLDEDVEGEDKGPRHRAHDQVPAALPDPSSDQADHEEGAEG